MEPMKSVTGYPLLDTVSRALGILRLFLDSQHGLSLTDVAHLSGLSKSSATRYLATLEFHGYLRRDSQSLRYHLGSAAVRLGAIAIRRLDVRDIADPYMAQLRDTYRETVNLAFPVPEGRIVYVQVLEANQTVRLTSKLGDEDYAHATALGKAMLAFMSQEQWERCRPKSLTQRTGNTITDWPSLERELDEVRERGFAIDYRESDAQVCCVGVPILGPHEEVVAALSVSGPASRMSLTTAQRIGPGLVLTANEISAQLGAHKAPRAGVLSPLSDG